MAKESVTQVSFAAGEISPHLHDRTDLESYYAGCAKLENFVPLPHGPLVRRQGMELLSFFEATTARLVPFSFNLEQSFILVFIPGAIYFFTKDGQVIDDDDTDLIVETDLREEDMPKLEWAQNGDWLYIVDGYHVPRALKRYSNYDWRFEDLELTDTPEEWEDTNQPKHIALFEQRAYYAATDKQPQQIWASMTGIYESFTRTTGDYVLDDNAFTYTLFSDDANGIEWLATMGTFIIGTAGAEFKMGSTSSTDPITPSNVSISVQTHYGSAAIKPVKIGSSVLFAQRSKNRIRAFEYSFSEDQYDARDVTLFASHVFSSPVVEMVAQSAPDSYLWSVDEEGKLIGCTYEKSQKVLAWHKHLTDGKIKSIGILPSNGNDILFVAVEREFNGEKQMCIETLSNAWEAIESITEGTYIDSFLSYTGEAISEVYGLDHLEGKEVSIFIDGWVHPNVVVSEGKVVLQSSGSDIRVGLPYSSTFVSLNPQSTQQPTIGSSRRISEAVVAVENSADFYYKAYGANHDYIHYNGPTKIMNSGIELTSRHDRLILNGPSSTSAQLEISQSNAVPLVIRGIVYHINPAKI